MKRALSTFMFVLLLVSMLTMTFKIQPARAEPKTWTVDDDGPADFTSIPEAIATANSGDTIYVYNGTYHEYIYIFHKSLTLIGENKYGTIVDADHGTAVRVELTQSVTITGFTIRNAEIGIYLYQSDNNTIIGNIVTNTEHLGIYLESSYNSIIIGNAISDMPARAAFEWSEGIRLWASYKNTVIGNVISNIGDFGVWLSHHSNTIVGNTITNCSCGVYIMEESYNNTIMGNTIADSPAEGSCGMNIFGFNNTIIGNRITNISYTGIRLNSYAPDPIKSTNNFVSGNIVSKTSQAIAVGFEASSNTVAGNNVSDSDIGLFVFDHSANNTFMNNYVSNNNYGIALFSSDDTRVYHNSFNDNVQQILLSESFNTAWDDGYPSGGNYWSDYVGVDMFRGPSQNENGSDGIGDTPYIVDTVNQDNYPLMAYGTGLRHVGDVNDDGKVNIMDIAMVARAFGSSIGQARYRLSCDFNFDGLIDIKDISVASRNFGWHKLFYPS